VGCGSAVTLFCSEYALLNELVPSVNRLSQHASESVNGRVQLRCHTSRSSYI
jgi:hypothetical protein